MALPLPPDFSAFLRSLNDACAEYLLVGGYAVGFHGYVRATADMDVWVRRSPDNARRVMAAVRALGFDVPALTDALFLDPDRLVRMGQPPMRVEVLTSISGVDFDTAWASRVETEWDGVPVFILGLADLRANKRASGRYKDLADLDALPPTPGDASA